VSEGVLVFRSRHSAPVIADLVTRFAAAFDVITGAQTITDGHLDGRIIRGLVTQRLVTADAPHTPTPHGLAWRASYTGAIAPIEAVTARKRRKWKTKPKPAPKPTPASLARAIVADGLLFIHPDMIEGPRALNGDELKLWTLCMKYRRAPLSLADVAHKLAETVAVTRIRAERIIEKRYALPLKQEDAA
jgi:hypothetical protein